MFPSLLTGYTSPSHVFYSLSCTFFYSYQCLKDVSLKSINLHKFPHCTSAPTLPSLTPQHTRMIREKNSHLYFSPLWAFVSLWTTARYTMQRQDNLPSNRKSHSDTPKVCFHQSMLPRGWSLTNHMQCNINFCMLLQADMLSVRWLFSPNRTIPLGKKLTLNMHFSCTLPGSCSHSLSVSLAYSLHLPSSSFSLIADPFIFLIPTILIFLHYSFFPSSILPLAPGFPILYFPYFSILPAYSFSCPIPLHPENNILHSSAATEP